MNPEDNLDYLIEQRELGETRVSTSNKDIAACLAAAEKLTRLREIDVPPELSHHLETLVRARARELHLLNGGAATPLAFPRQPARRARHPRRRAWLSAIGIVAVLVLSCLGVLTASARSLPGDPFYSVKQAEYQLVLNFASDAQNRAGIKIDQLRGTLGDLSTVVSNGRDDSTIKLALDMVAASTVYSQQAVSALPAGSAREAAQHNLDGVLAQEEQTLRGLLGRVDWSMQLAFTHQLGALGYPVPTIASADVRAQSNGTLLVTLLGRHFAPQAEFLFDGRAGGIVSQITATRMVAILNRSVWSPATNALGVRNPDGTAAQTLYHGSDDDHDRQDDGGSSSSGSNHGSPDSDGDFDD